MYSEDERVITENHNLIYSFLLQYKFDIEEYYDLAAIGLVKAVKTYNPEKGKLSTWAYKIMYNEIGTYFRRTKLRGQVKSIISYESLLGEEGQSDGQSLRILDTLESSEVAMEDNLIYISDIDKRIHLLSLLEIELIADKVKGINQRELATKYGYSQAYISKLIKQAYKVLTDRNEPISKKRLEYRNGIKNNKELLERFNTAYDTIKQVMNAETQKQDCKAMARKERVIVYPGSFNPITLGHLDIIKRASVLFDKVIVVIGINQDKEYKVSAKERQKLIEKACDGIGNVEVDTFKGLLADYVKDKNAIGVVKGLRAVSDFESEFQQALTNRSLNEDFETIFIPSRLEYTYLSSSMVRQILKLGGNIDKFIPQSIRKDILKKYGEKEEDK